MTQEEVVATAKAMQVAMSPVRLRILFALREGELSPVQYTKTLDDGPPLTNLSYHFRTLRDSKLIRLKQWKKVRGAIEHIYELTENGREVLKQLEKTAG
jgi:hypothetical protein